MTPYIMSWCVSEGISRLIIPVYCKQCGVLRLPCFVGRQVLSFAGLQPERLCLTFV